MSSLRDIEAHCERDKSRMDSQHERMDRLSSDEGSSNEGTAQQMPGPASPYAPPPPGPSPAVAIVAILAVLVLLVAVVMIFLVLPGDRSPEDVYKGYVDASNDRDVKRMFDNTVTKFDPDYEQRLENLSEIVFFLDPQIEIVDLVVIYKDNMSEFQELASQVFIDDVQTKLSVIVEDHCYVQYEVNVHYGDIDQTANFDGEILCVKIDGDWLLVVPGYY